MSNASAASDILLMSRERVGRSINRIAYQIAEENRNEADILIVGIKQRGYTVAKLLGERLNALTNKQVDVRQLLIDDEKENFLEHSDAESGYTVLVDDVIFSGQTMFTALQKILKVVQPEVLRTAVLVDRGHRTFPIEAGFVGLALPTKLNEHVRVETASGVVKKVVLNTTSG